MGKCKIQVGDYVSDPFHSEPAEVLFVTDEGVWVDDCDSGKMFFRKDEVSLLSDEQLETYVLEEKK